MITFEVSALETDLVNELREVFMGKYNEIGENSFNSSEIIQILVPVSVVLAPALSTIIQNIMSNEKITIKDGTFEITAKGKRNALKIYKEMTRIHKNKPHDNA